MKANSASTPPTPTPDPYPALGLGPGRLYRGTWFHPALHGVNMEPRENDEQAQKELFAAGMIHVAESFMAFCDDRDKWYEQRGKRRP